MRLQNTCGIEAPSTVMPAGTGQRRLFGSIYSNGSCKRMRRPSESHSATTRPLNWPAAAKAAPHRLVMTKPAVRNGLPSANPRIQRREIMTTPHCTGDGGTLRNGMVPSTRSDYNPCSPPLSTHKGQLKTDLSRLHRIDADRY